MKKELIVENIEFYKSLRDDDQILAEMELMVLEFNEEIEKSLKNIQEGILTLGIAVGLSLPKVMEFLGIIGKKAYNYLIKKGVIKGNKVDQTLLEKWGEKIHHWIIDKIFGGISKGILKLMGLEVGESTVRKMSYILFYITIGYFSITGFESFISHFSEVPSPILKGLSTIIKTYEIGIILYAVFLYLKYKEARHHDIPHIAHSIEQCVEGQIKVLMSKEKEKALSCIYRNVGIKTETGTEENKGEGVKDEGPAVSPTR